jgi:hypothetical protein
MLCCFVTSNGALMNDSVTVYDFKLLTDQYDAPNQFSYGLMLFDGDWILMNKSLLPIIFNCHLIKAMQRPNCILVSCFSRVKTILTNKLLAARDFG